VDAAARREARKQWKGQIFRTWEEAEAFDAQFWLSIPIDERASITWQLSEELHRLANPNEPHEPRLRRSVAVVTRR
jgi:hypothetical protein